MSVEKNWKEDFEHWLIHNLQLTSKSNVELIIKHVEHYFIEPLSAPNTGKGGVWQLCPKCNGSGQVFSGLTTYIYATCDLCNGAKVLAPPETSLLNTGKADESPKPQQGIEAVEVLDDVFSKTYSDNKGHWKADIPNELYLKMKAVIQPLINNSYDG
jgi:hypothetical protein